MLIEVEGDVAHSESYLIANCVLKGDRAKVEDTFGPSYAAKFDWDEVAGIPHEFFFGGRYFDRFERRNGEWRIAERMLLMDWNRCDIARRSEEHTSELQSLMRISYAVFCLKKKNSFISYHN